MTPPFDVAFRIAAHTGARGDGDDRAALITAADDAGLMLVLADGAGGTGGGAEAAEAVVAAVRRRADELLGHVVDASQLLDDLDQQLARSRSGGQTTALVVAVDKGGIRGASVGDSEAWQIGPAGVRVLTAHQRRKPLLGSGEALVVSFDVADTRGTLLLGSDGLFKYARRERILEMLGAAPIADAADQLVELARLPGGSLQDDVSVIVCAAAAPP